MLDYCVNIEQKSKRKAKSNEKLFAQKGLSLKTLLSDCRKQGMTLEEMASKLEIERSSVFFYLKKYGLTKNKPRKEVRLQKDELGIWQRLSLTDAIKDVRQSNPFACMALPTSGLYHVLG